MKKLFFTIGLCTVISLTAQDFITKKTGEDIKAKVLEVTTTEIKYKKFDNMNGPTFTISKAELLMIRYENGTKDMFTESLNDIKTNLSDNAVKQNIEEYATTAMNDARTNYRGQNSGAGWVVFTTMIASPILGIIPAAACASKEPNDQNLNYKSQDLMKIQQYNNAYKTEAHRIKKKSVWTAYGIGSAGWLVLALLL
jgi:hypothetical protein